MKLHYLWNIDPGYFHLKHAAKTIAAILISLALVRNEPLFIQMMAGVATGFSMQGVVAKVFPSRVLQVLTLDAVYFLVFNLGLLVRDSVSLCALTLVALGFGANYVRRFGLQTSVAPMMGWTLCFFATTLPFPSAVEAWNHIGVLAEALCVSAVSILLIFPEHYPRLFVSNTNRLFDLMSKGMHELRRETLWVDVRSTFDAEPFERITDKLTRLLESNQAIEQSDVFLTRYDHVSSLLTQQYALVHVYLMIIDAYCILSRHEHQFSRATRLQLNGLYKKFELVFRSLSVTADYSIVCKNSAQFFSKIVLPVSDVSLTEPAMIVVILNLKLSFHLLEKQVAHLLRGVDDF